MFQILSQGYSTPKSGKIRQIANYSMLIIGRARKSKTNGNGSFLQLGFYLFKTSNQR